MGQNEAAATMDMQTEEQAPAIDPAKLAAFNAQRMAEQNLPLGIVGGVLAAMLGAAVWAGVTVATGYQIGWMAIGVGFLAGYAVRMLGKGVTPTFGGVAAACALLGCIVGNLLSTCGFYALQESAPFLQIAQTVFSRPALMVELLKSTFSPMDLLFYGLALYTGYKCAFRQVTQAELATLGEN